MRVVIVGGGFGALQFAKTRRSKLRAHECEILLFSRENHMVFHPLLADVAGASINADAAAAPLRQMLPGAGCRTERVTHSYYRPGDFIHRQGEPARTFSIIEEGQVEVLQQDPGAAETKVLAVLSKGDFFGEGALLGNRPHETSIRARSAVRLRQ